MQPQKSRNENDSTSRGDKLMLIPPGALDSTDLPKKRKARRKNKCKEVAKLKSGTKLNVKFYNMCVVGKNHRVFSRHLGRIVRDRNICPLHVHSWKETRDEEKKHMWAAVTNKIVDATQLGPSLSNIELVEECFGPQRHNHITCYGGGLKPNDMKTIGTRAELQAKLCETQKENDSLKNRMDEMEAEVRMIKEMLQRQHSNSPPSFEE